MITQMMTQLITGCLVIYSIFHTIYQKQLFMQFMFLLYCNASLIVFTKLSFETVPKVQRSLGKRINPILLQSSEVWIHEPHSFYMTKKSFPWGWRCCMFNKPLVKLLSVSTFKEVNLCKCRVLGFWNYTSIGTFCFLWVASTHIIGSVISVGKTYLQTMARCKGL